MGLLQPIAAWYLRQRTAPGRLPPSHYPVEGDIGIGLAIGNVPVWVAGIIIALSGMVAGVVMRGRGLGQPVPERTRTDWYGDRA